MYIFTGYRSVPLKNEYSEPLELAALLVWVDMRNPKVIITYTPKYTVKPVLSGHSKRRPNIVFNTEYRFMQIKSIAECNGSILQYFRPSLRYHLSLRSLFCLFLIGCLRQVLLYGLSVILTLITLDISCTTFLQFLLIPVIACIYKQSGKQCGSF